MYFEDYSPEAVRPNVVPAEGDYDVTVTDVLCGEFDGDRTGERKRYTRVVCEVEAEGKPRLSIFLTEGKGFGANATCFYDTFGIPRGNLNADGWKGRRGRVHIVLTKKNGYVNMEPRWILGDDGYVSTRRPRPSDDARAEDYEGGGMYDADDILF